MVKVRFIPEPDSPSDTAVVAPKPAVDMSLVKSKVAARIDAQTILNLAIEAAERHTGEALHEFWSDLAKAAEESRLQVFKSLSADQRLNLAFGPAAERAAGFRFSEPDQPAKPKRSVVSSSNESVLRAIQQCDRILDDIDELPARANENGFASSVEKKVSSIRETIEEADRVTDRQLEALSNMGEGVRRWLD